MARLNRHHLAPRNTRKVSRISRKNSKAAARMAENVKKDRVEYDRLSHSGLHFMKEVAESGGADMPMVIDPRPAGYMDRVRSDFPDVDFVKPNTLKIEGISLP